MKLTLTRTSTTDQGTCGILELETGLTLHTIELPWRGNKNCISCIPTGTYELKAHSSPKYSLACKLENVPNREAILIHVGNWAGDKNKGFKSDVEGCILVGKEAGKLAGQRAVLKSQDAMVAFRDELNTHEAVKSEPHYITIIEDY